MLASLLLSSAAALRVGPPLASRRVVAMRHQQLRGAVSGPLSGVVPPGTVPDGRAGIILFDGVCNFCNRWVTFVLDNDPDGLFCFASLQSSRGRELLQSCGRSADDLSTVVVIDRDGSFYTQSSAALRVGQVLQRPALNVLASSLVSVPAPVRDGVYRLVAENRWRPSSLHPTDPCDPRLSPHSPHRLTPPGDVWQV